MDYTQDMYNMHYMFFHKMYGITYGEFIESSCLVEWLILEESRLYTNEDT